MGTGSAKRLTDLLILTKKYMIPAALFFSITKYFFPYISFTVQMITWSGNTLFW